ncbi:MAG: glycosyltransferase family 9 protein [Acidihalobacter sp.]
MRLQPGTALLYGLLRIVQRLDRRARDVSDFDPAGVRRLLVVSTTALGDTAMSTAGIRALRRRYPQARITALLHPVNGRLLAHSQDIDERLFYAGRYNRFLSTLRDLRRHRFDVAVVFHGNEPQMTPLLYLAGIPFIFKLPNLSRYRFLLSNHELALGWPQIGHGLRQRLAVAQLAGADSDDPHMHLDIDETQRGTVRDTLQQAGIADDALLIGFQAGASSRRRAWPAAHFAELGRTLTAHHPGARIVLTGSPAERELCAGIARDIGPAAVSLAGELDIEALPALIERIQVLVTGDTGTMHVAVAVRTPTVCLFGASDPAGAGPIYDLERHTLIVRSWDAAAKALTDPMARIDVDEVRAAVETTLDQHTAD